jgi:dihydrofolate reductase
MGIYFYGCMTLDGYLADKKHNLEWLHESGSIEETSFESFYQSMNITVMGRKTFNEIYKLGNPSQFYPKTENYVFTHDKNISVDGFKMIEGDVVSFVKNIDKSTNVWIVGGNTILAPLIDHDIVDVLIVQIAPVLLGEGIPLFTQNESLRRYHLKEVNKYGQFAELVYTKKESI